MRPPTAASVSTAADAAAPLMPANSCDGADGGACGGGGAGICGSGSGGVEGAGGADSGSARGSGEIGGHGDACSVGERGGGNVMFGGGGGCDGGDTGGSAGGGSGVLTTIRKMPIGSTASTVWPKSVESSSVLVLRSKEKALSATVGLGGVMVACTRMEAAETLRATLAGVTPRVSARRSRNDFQSKESTEPLRTKLLRTTG
jgi:hypothetical protein